LGIALSWSEVASQFIEEIKELLCRGKVFEPQQGIVALFGSPVILFDPIVFVAATPMLHTLQFHNGPRIRVVTGTEHRIDERPVLVDGSIQVTLPPNDLQIGLIGVLKTTHFVLASTLDVVS
jgi:hypothetical protein